MPVSYEPPLVLKSSSHGVVVKRFLAVAECPVSRRTQPRAAERCHYWHTTNAPVPAQLNGERREFPLTWAITARIMVSLR